MGPEDLVLDVLGDLGVFVDFVDGDEGQDVLGCDDLLPQGVVEPNPEVHQHGHVDDADRQHHPEEDGVIGVDEILSAS